MGNKIILDEDYLNEAIKQAFRSLVGEQMKRFEVLKDSEDVKKACKELSYEKERELRAVLRAFNFGVKFISPQKVDKQ